MKRFRKHTRQILGVLNDCHEAFIGFQCGKETVHDLRVSVRRLMPVMHVLTGLENDLNKVVQLRHHQKRCKNVFKALSAPRDLEVQLRLATSLQQSQSWPDHVIHPYIEGLYAEKTQLDQDIVLTVQAMGLSESIKFVSRQVKHFSYDKSCLREMLYTLHTQLEGRLRQSFVKLKKQPEQFHQTRIRLKKYRYHVELESAVGGNNQADQAELLKQIQDHLGETHDLSVALQLMKARQVDDSVMADVEQLYQCHLERSVDYLFSRETLLWK